MKNFIIVLFVILASLGNNSGAFAQPGLTVMAGIALRPVLEEAAANFKERHKADITFIFGGSGEVLSKLRLTRTGDVFIPASHDYIELALEYKVLEKDSLKTLAYLVPALFVARGNPKNIRNLADLAMPGVKLAFSRPETVAIGLYAAEIVEKSLHRDEIRKNINTNLENVAKTVNAVAVGSADAAFAWRAMATWPSIRCDLVELAADDIKRVASIRAAVTKVCKNNDLAEKFVEYLSSESGSKLFLRHGYTTDLAEVQKLAPVAEIGGEFALPESWK